MSNDDGDDGDDDDKRPLTTMELHQLTTFAERVCPAQVDVDRPLTYCDRLRIRKAPSEGGRCGVEGTKDLSFPWPCRSFLLSLLSGDTSYHFIHILP